MSGTPQQLRTYGYVGPKDIRDANVGKPAGEVIDQLHALLGWLQSRIDDGDQDPDGLVRCTYVVDVTGNLRLAPRRSEHVACAAGERVLAAGELGFLRTSPGQAELFEASNQSTGYCPEPSCWVALERALDQIEIECPDGFTCEITFRRCVNEACLQRNIVKDNWFVCGVCEHDLPSTWNFDAEDLTA